MTDSPITDDEAEEAFARWVRPPVDLRDPTARPGELEDQVAASQAAAPAPVVNWRHASPGEIQDLWAPLREFTEWLITVFELRANEVPACWWRHPDILQELYGLMTSHEIWYWSTDQGVGPLMWVEHLASSRTRLTSMTSTHGCTHNEHRPAAVTRTAEGITRVSDTEWSELTGSPARYRSEPTWPSRGEN